MEKAILNITKDSSKNRRVVDIYNENGIVFCNFASDCVVDLEIAQQMVKERLEFQNGEEYPVMIRLNGLKFGTSEARNHMKKEGQKGIKAGAFIISNPVEKIIMNFLFTIAQPQVPAKMFTNEKDALTWLEQFK